MGSFNQTEYLKQWYLQNKESHNKKSAEYRVSPKGRYAQQRAHAIRRGIPWEFTFESWWKIWQDSGKWEERSKRKYVMCRTNDEGAYSPENVRIDTFKNNIREYWNNKHENQCNNPQ